MISKLFIENYRSLRQVEMPLGKINVLTGANNSGKTSVLLAAYTLKNIVSNPNRSLEQLLAFPFLNLGGFEELVFQRKVHNKIKIGIENEIKGNYPVYLVAFNQGAAVLEIKEPTLISRGAKMGIAFPYPLNKTIPLDIQYPTAVAKMYKSITLNWNGAIFNFSNNETTHAIQSREILTSPIEHINKIELVTLSRYFTRPYYGLVPITDMTTEEQIASVLAKDRNLESGVSHYFEKIFNAIFSVRPTIGTSNFYLQVRDNKTGFTTDLVNQGSGLNQIAFMLSKILMENSQFICIDEPETHLHPSIIDKLMDAFVELANQEGKQFLISTHNEHLIESLLNKVVEGKIKPEEVKVYHATKTNQETTFEAQAINEKGQIEGGLSSFYETEMEHMKAFFKL